MSHNSKYYVKKLKSQDGSKCRKLESFGFKKAFLLASDSVENNTENSDSESQTTCGKETTEPDSHDEHTALNIENQCDSINIQNQCDSNNSTDSDSESASVSF